MRALIVAVALLAAACQREAVTAPDLSATSPARSAAEVSAVEVPAGEASTAAAPAADVRATGAADDDNRPPEAVFKTRPAADGDDVIAGGSAFSVTFNLCQSTDPDRDDDLRFTFDFDGDGTVDQLGHCRASHRYEVGAYESGCTAAIACVTDRQPDHRVCRTYQVCAQGRSREPAGLPDPTPTPTPTPTPGPQVFVEQSIAGDLPPVSARDAWSFIGEPGSEVTIFVDTVSSATAYWMQTCISKSTQLRDCVRPQSSDRVACSYPPPGGLGCPRKTTILPPVFGRRYYVIVGGFRFTETDGRYVAVVRTAPAVGALSLALDNGDHPASVEP